MNTAGYSLLELMMIVALVAVMLGLGLPELSRLGARQKQSVEINALFHAIHLARKESIVRRRVVSLCPSFDGQTCTPGRDWSAGFLMFENTDRDEPPQVDPGEPILRRHRAAETIRITANRRGFTLRAVFKRATNGTFVICDQANRIRPKALIVSYTGRPRVSFETPSRRPANCVD